MRNQAVSFMYALNIVLQSLFSLLFSVAIFVGGAYLLTEYAGLGSWVYIPAVLLGLGLGSVSMVRFILAAMAGLERLEKQKEKDNSLRRGNGKD